MYPYRNIFSRFQTGRYSLHISNMLLYNLYSHKVSFFATASRMKYRYITIFHFITSFFSIFSTHELKINSHHVAFISYYIIKRTIMNLLAHFYLSFKILLKSFTSTVIISCWIKDFLVRKTPKRSPYIPEIKITIINILFRDFS